MKPSQWLRRVTDRASARSIADKIGRSHTAVSRWIRDERIPCEVVLEIAHAYNADAVEGLFVSGYLRREDFAAGTLLRVVRQAPTSMLIEELTERSKSWGEAVKSGKRWAPPVSWVS
jgi:transcriptional regulator with XRE-family HTH domain